MNKKNEPLIAGVVVLYNPEAKMLQNILSYVNEIGILYVVDNSEECTHPLKSVLESIGNVVYINNHGNRGIAFALNMGAKLALDHNYEWLLTMDQDSKVSKDMLHKMKSFIVENSNEKVGIVSPFHLTRFSERPNTAMPYSTQLTVMTSGNLLNLHAFKAVGPFLEKLFVDYVDIEYCLRLNKCGFTVTQLNNAVLHHELGDTWQVGVGFLKTTTSNHGAIRRYYMTRNRFLVRSIYKKDYPEFLWDDLVCFFKQTIKIIVFEKDKYQKIAKTMQGYFDYRKDHFGKYLK